MQLDTPLVFEESDLTATIVICTRNRPTLLRKCLEGIAHLERTPDQVIVVDNTSGDKETETVARGFAAVYTVEPIRGLSRARNRGMSESNSEIVAYLDDDAVPDERWLGNLLGPFKDPQVAAVTGRIVTPQSPAENSTSQVVRFLSSKDPKWFEIVTFGGFGLGSNMAFRRKTCADQRVFDERLGRGAPFQIAEENCALAFLLSHGYTAVYLPDAIVFHPSLKPLKIAQEARNRIAYWMLLFSEFPDRRLELLRFLFRRMRRKRLTWPRNAPDPGEIITSGWRVLLAASLGAVLLFFRTRKPKDK
jgi:glycosyltransferase involved in cell wall biosynthesis